VVLGFLYYRPLSSYLETRHALDARRADVAALRATRAQLEIRLEASSSANALARAARSIGYVRPGEQLFIVKGIAQWRRGHRAAAPG
jgi:cell division protein FtsB